MENVETVPVSTLIILCILSSYFNWLQQTKIAKIDESSYNLNVEVDSISFTNISTVTHYCQLYTAESRKNRGQIRIKMTVLFLTKYASSLPPQYTMQDYTISKNLCLYQYFSIHINESLSSQSETNPVKSNQATSIYHSKAVSALSYFITADDNNL